MAEKVGMYRCEGCGEWLDPDDVLDCGGIKGHIVTHYDSEGHPFPELCGPCRPWEETEEEDWEAYDRE